MKGKMSETEAVMNKQTKKGKEKSKGGSSGSLKGMRDREWQNGLEKYERK